MQLTIRDLTKLLKADEGTILRWIKNGGLPAQFVGGQYRFHRTDILQWATTNRVKVSPELFSQPNDDEESNSSLAEALEAGGIFYQLPDTNKENAVRALVRILPLPTDVDRDLLLRLLLAREASASTAIGGGIALPHVCNPIVLHVDRPLVTLGFLERPVDFGAADGQPVRILFTLICPSVRSHLRMLARLSYALHDERFRTVVTQTAAPEEILHQAARVESQMAPLMTATGKVAR